MLRITAKRNRDETSDLSDLETATPVHTPMKYRPGLGPRRKKGEEAAQDEDNLPKIDKQQRVLELQTWIQQRKI